MKLVANAERTLAVQSGFPLIYGAVSHAKKCFVYDYFDFIWKLVNGIKQGTLMINTRSTASKYIIVGTTVATLVCTIEQGICEKSYRLAN